MFLFHAAFNELCLCIYIFKKNSKKKIQFFFKISKSFQKKKKREKNFQMKKSLWTRGIEPLSHLKKKKKIELGALDFLVTFSKNAHFFLIKISRF